MPTPPNSPAAPKRHKAQTARPAKQPADTNRKGSTTPHKTDTSFNKEGKPANYIPEIPAATAPEVDKPVEPVTEKKTFFGNLFNK